MSRPRSSDRRDRPGRGPGRQRRSKVPPQTVRIESIAAGGEGVGRLEDGRVVFVHRTAPGDLVEVSLVHQQKRWTRGRVLRLLEESPDRREAPCPFYVECGGCTLEHLTYPAQLKAKARIVSDALARIGGLGSIEPEVVASPRENRYRNRVSFALRRGEAGRVTAGFHALGDPDRIVDIDGRCLLPEESISAVWDQLRSAWGPDANRLPSGEQLRLTLRGSSHGEVSMLVEGGFSPGRPDELLRAVHGLSSIWHRPSQAAPTLIAGAPGLPEKWGAETVELSGAAFLQVNREAAALLEDHVLDIAAPSAGMRVVDAYCGIGLHARRLARAGALVTGLELDAEAVAEAQRAAPPGAVFKQADVAEALPRHLPADLIILNPPRSGVDEAVTKSLVAQPPRRLIYVSCNPATLARDLQRLGGVLHLDSVRCFDLFPQTAHVETVVLLSSAVLEDI
jgi:23S rRNA (uracil1939-C5)-methyltransferase